MPEGTAGTAPRSVPALLVLLLVGKRRLRLILAGQWPEGLGRLAAVSCFTPGVVSALSLPVASVRTSQLSFQPSLHSFPPREMPGDSVWAVLLCLPGGPAGAAVRQPHLCCSRGEGASPSSKTCVRGAALAAPARVRGHGGSSGRWIVPFPGPPHWGRESCLVSHPLPRTGTPMLSSQLFFFFLS